MPSTPSPAPIVPPLKPGDRLSRAEFEQRYEAMLNIKKAELIEGVVYMPSPVRLHRHANPHGNLVAWVVTYAAYTPHVISADNATARLDLDNEPQPDAMLLIDPAHGGQANISADDYIENAPELVAEVSGSTVSFDMHTKMNVYRRNGVREYIVWRVLDKDLDWFVLRAGQFAPLASDPAGLLKSETFPGLWLDKAALLAGDMPRVLAVLQQGLASPEHAAFVSTHPK
jgi:Uma2 family endonuclease